MKTKLYLLALVALVMHFSASSQVKIGDNPTTINSASLLELETTNKGLVLPRVSLTNVTSVSPLASGALTGTVIYNTNTGTTGGSGAGIYYWDGSKWNFLANTSITSNYWSQIGNSGTSYATNFLGTTDNVSMRFRTNNVQRMIIDSVGRVGIGINNPAYALSVVAASNPLYLSGVQPQTLTLLSPDSILTINNGIVKKTPFISLLSVILGGGTPSWTLTGNIGINSGIEFLGTGDNASLRMRTNNIERMVVDSLGNIGMGITKPTYKLQVLATSNPLYLAGVQATSTFSSDSVLTINGGVVKKAPYSSLSNYWSLTGNSTTNSSINFLGTTDNHPLKFRVNNILSGLIDSIGGNENTFFGRGAGFKNTTGNTNTLVGIEADSLNTTGANITAVGYQAAANNTSTGLVALGYQAGYGNTSGQFNMFLGTSSGFANSTGANNAFMGYGSGFANTTGNNNAFSGYASGLGNTIGFNNTFTGSNAGSTNTTGSYNTAVGYLAGYRNITGSRNLFLGDSTASYNSTALNNASAIGFRATVGQNNSMVLGDTTNSGTIANSYPVNVGIGVRFPQKRLHIDAATIGFPGQSDSLKIDNLAASASDYNKSILVIDSSTGFVSRQSLATFANNDYWSLTGNSGTNYATNFLGTTDNVSLRFRTNNVQRMLIDSLGSVGIGSANFNPNLKEKFLVDYGTTTSNNVATFTGSINDYMQIGVQNKSNGINASSDFVATSDDGTDSTNYVDLGINSSNYAPSVDNFGGPHDGYLYSYSRNLIIGTQKPSSDIIFLSGGGVTRTNSVFRMDGTTGNIIVGRGENNTNAAGNTLRAANGGGTNIAGGILTLQGGSGTGTAAGGALNLNGGTTGSGTAGNIVMSTAATERIRIDQAGNVGIGISNPSNKLSVLAASNPLYLSGVQATATFTTDSILTINGGVVKKAPYSSLPTGGLLSGWALTGNALTNPAINFLGTTDAQPLIIKSLNRQLGYFDGNLYSIALGFGAVNNTSDHNIAIGYNASTNNQYTLALGYSATASGVRSVAIGNGGSATTASGAESVAIGYNATASSNQTAAFGYQANASGAYALALGYTSVASSGQTTAIGYNAQATGQYGIAIGYQAQASTNSQTTAIGMQAVANQQYATAIGYNAQATGTQSTAIGYNAQTAQSNTILLGSASTPNLYVGIGTTTPTAKLHIVGGTTTNYPLQLVGLPTGVAGTDNIMTVNSTGVVGYVTPATFNNTYWNLAGNAASSGNFLGTTNSTPLQFKFNSTAAGYLDANNTSFGTSATATAGSSNTAIGFSATASNSATAIGANAAATQANTTAIGNSASANTSSQATAIGASSQALFQNNVAVGYSAQATTSSQETVVGAAAQAQGQNNISIGYSAKANGSDKMTVVGANAQGSFQNNTVIGYSALATVNNQATAIGATAAAQAQNATALGYAASASGINSTAIGYNAVASQNNTLVLGDATNTSLNVGIGLIAPPNKLSVLSSSNPLYLSGVQATSTFTTDSLLTINAGVVKKTPYSSLSTVAWNTAGNTGTTASTAAIGSTVNSNFIGTTDAKDFVFATNNLEAMRLTSGGNLGLGITAPENIFHIVDYTVQSPTPDNMVTIETRNTTASQGSQPPQLSHVRQIPTSAYTSGTQYLGAIENFAFRVPGSSTYNNFAQWQGSTLGANGVIGFATRTGMTNGNPATGTITGGITTATGFTYNMVLNGTVLAVANLTGTTTGSLSADLNGNIIRTPSDLRLKTNVTTMSNSLDKVMQLRGVSYNWIDTKRFGTQKEIGFIAQEVEKVLPEVVNNGKDYKSVNYQVLTAVLANAMQEQQKQIEDQKAKQQTLQQTLTDQQKTIDLLVQQVKELKDKIK